LSFWFKLQHHRTKQSGESAPETADLYYSYGKALLENAIAQAGVMGKEETEGALKGDDKGAPENNYPALMWF